MFGLFWFFATLTPLTIHLCSLLWEDNSTHTHWNILILNVNLITIVIIKTSILALLYGQHKLGLEVNDYTRHIIKRTFFFSTTLSFFNLFRKTKI